MNYEEIALVIFVEIKFKQCRFSILMIEINQNNDKNLFLFMRYYLFYVFVI